VWGFRKGGWGGAACANGAARRLEGGDFEDGVGAGAGGSFEVAGDLAGGDVDDGDLVFVLEGEVGGFAVAGEGHGEGAAGEFEAGDFLTGGDVGPGDAFAEVVENGFAAIDDGQASGAGAGGDALFNFAAGGVDAEDEVRFHDGEVEALGIGGEDAALGILAGGDEADLAGGKVDGGEGAAAGVADVGGIAGGVEGDHVGGLALGVVAAEDFALLGIDEEETGGAFDGDDELMVVGVEVHAVGAVVVAEIEAGGELAGVEVDDGDGVAALALVGHPEHAIFGDEGEAAVGGEDEFVGVGFEGDGGEALAGGGAIEAESVTLFFDDGEVLGQKAGSDEGEPEGVHGDRVSGGDGGVVSGGVGSALLFLVKLFHGGRRGRWPFTSQLGVFERGRNMRPSWFILIV